MHEDQPFTHLDEKGQARMVDVGGKPLTARQATAQSIIRMQPSTLSRILNQSIAKGDVLATARIAGIMAVKRTADLIPLCHPLPIDAVELSITPWSPDRLKIIATVRTVWRTGVEMEALTAASVAALTVYDMCKAFDRGMSIEQTLLLEKSGGRSGSYQRETPNQNQGEKPWLK